MLKICVLEDEAAQMERMKAYLQKFQSEHADFEYVLDAYKNAFDLLEHYKRDVDLLFLDIRVPDMSGMEVAHRIREADQNVMIIFVTNLTQYAIEATQSMRLTISLNRWLTTRFPASWSVHCGCSRTVPAISPSTSAPGTVVGVSPLIPSLTSRFQTTTSSYTLEPNRSGSGERSPNLKHSSGKLILSGAAQVILSI